MSAAGPDEERMKFSVGVVGTFVGLAVGLADRLARLAGRSACLVAQLARPPGWLVCSFKRLGLDGATWRPGSVVWTGGPVGW